MSGDLTGENSGRSEADMWGQLVIDSLVRPRTAAQRVLAFEIGWSPLAQIAVAIACIGMVLGYAAMAFSGGPVDPMSAAVLSRPLIGAATQLGVMALIVALTVRIGRAFGGVGGPWGATMLVVWLNAMTLLVQVVQLVLLVLAPPLAGILAIAMLVWLLWAYSNFAAELHGFASPVMVLGVSVLSLVALVLGLTLLAAILGLSPTGGA
jgi:hypothetical protein